MKRLLPPTPFSQLKTNPLFLRDTRRVAWMGSADSLRRQTIRWIAFAAVLPIVLYLALVIIETVQISSFYRGSILRLIDIPTYVLGSTALSLGAILLVDLGALNQSIRAISGEHSANRWDLLRLTPLGINQMIRAKVGTAQMRAWRVTARVIGLRLGVLIVWLSETVRHYGSASTTNAPLWLITFVIAGGLVGAPLMIEPIWRVRAAAAVGVAYSAKSWGTGGAFAAAGALLLASWLIYGVVLLLLAYCGVIMITLLLFSAGELPLPTLMFLAVAAGALTFTIRTLHDLIARFGMRAAARWSLDL